MLPPWPGSKAVGWDESYRNEKHPSLQPLHRNPDPCLVQVSQLQVLARVMVMFFGGWFFWWRAYAKQGRDRSGLRNSDEEKRRVVRGTGPYILADVCPKAQQCAIFVSITAFGSIAHAFNIWAVGWDGVRIWGKIVRGNIQSFWSWRTMCRGCTRRFADAGVACCSTGCVLPTCQGRTPASKC